MGRGFACEVFPPVWQGKLGDGGDTLHCHNNLDSPPRGAQVPGWVQALTPFERREVRRLDPACVAYWGQHCRRKVQARRNGDYSDADGRYRCAMGDHVAWRYEVLTQLGCGSFGCCYRALDHGTGSFVALKILRRRRGGGGEGEMLMRLAEAGGRLRRRIVQHRDHFVFRGHACIVCELLGPDLLAHLRLSGGGLPHAEVLTVARETLDALRMLQEAGVVHCDIKPENVVLTRGSTFHVKLVDFGSACYTNRTAFE